MIAIHVQVFTYSTYFRITELLTRLRYHYPIMLIQLIAKASIILNLQTNLLGTWFNVAANSTDVIKGAPARTGHSNFHVKY